MAMPTSALETALRDKAPFVDHVTSQMDFDTKLIAAWVRRLRAEAFAPSIVIGVPGVADPQKLLNVAARIGVKDAKRFLVKNLRFVTGMARSGGFYKPTGFVEAMAPLLADADARVIGFHLYTFNAVEATEAWRRSMLER
jgi:methylenetetrahydrofolate reductase (NADPH)